MSLGMRKPAFCICENNDADQLRSNCPKVFLTFSQQNRVVILYIEIIICQFSYHTPYQPETPISARDSRISPRAEGPRADTGVSG